MSSSKTCLKPPVAPRRALIREESGGMRSWVIFRIAWPAVSAPRSLADIFDAASLLRETNWPISTVSARRLAHAPWMRHRRAPPSPEAPARSKKRRQYAGTPQPTAEQVLAYQSLVHERPVGTLGGGGSKQCTNVGLQAASL